MKTTENTERIAIFHISGGGGNRKLIDFEMFADKFDADYFGEMYYITFENERDLFEVLGNNASDILDKNIGADLTVFAENFDKYKDAFDKLMQDLDLDFTAKDLGVPVLVGGSRNVLCELAEYNSKRGYFDIDGDYDTYYWLPISELSDKELTTIIYDARDELLAEVENDTAVEFLIKNYADTDVIILAIQEKLTLRDLEYEGHIGWSREDGYYLD